MKRRAAWAVLISVFVIGVIHDIKAAGLAVISSTECHKSQDADFVPILDVAHKISESLQDGLSVVFPFDQILIAEFDECKAGSRQHSNVSHRVRFIAPLGDWLKDSWAAYSNRGVALGNRSGRPSDIGYNPFYFQRATWECVRQTDTANNKFGSEGSNQRLAGRCGGKTGCFSSRFGIIHASAHVEKLPIQDGLASGDQAQHGSEESRGVVRRPLPEGFPLFMLDVGIVGFFGTLGLCWLFLGLPDSGKPKSKNDQKN